MADPTEPTEPNAPASPTEPAAPSAPEAAPALTMDMVKALVAEEARKAYDAGAAAARRATQEKQAKAPAPQAPKNDATPPAAGNDAEFAEVLADALNEFPFDKEQRRAIRDAARSRKPEDVDGFVAQWARMFGKSPGAAPSPTQPNQPPQAAKPATPSIPNTPPPAGTPADGSNSPVFRALSEEDRRDAFNAYIRRSGGNPANLRAPETRKALGAMRREFESAAAITNVSIGARPTR